MPDLEKFPQALDYLSAHGQDELAAACVAMANSHAVLQEERELRRAAMDRVEVLEVALAVVADEIEGGDLQYALAFARKALEGGSQH